MQLLGGISRHSSYTLRLVTCQSCTAHTHGQDCSYRLMRHTRHAHIRDNYVGAKLTREIHRGLSVHCFADDLVVLIRLQLWGNKRSFQHDGHQNRAKPQRRSPTQNTVRLQAGRWGAGLSYSKEFIADPSTHSCPLRARLRQVLPGREALRKFLLEPFPEMMIENSISIFE
jgi:hypothetical protein